MGVIGFSFLKFECERNEVKPTKSIEIKHNISIQDVELTAFNVSGNKNDVLRVKFSFEIIYGENLGKISILGDVVYSDTKEIVEESFNGWKKDKKLNKLVHNEVLQFVYTKSSIKALEFADMLNLPSPIPLPKLNFSEKKN